MRKLLIVGALVLAGCRGHLEFPKPPADKLACAEEPGRPGTPGEPVTDEQATRYMVDLRKAGQDCRSDVLWLHDWFGSLEKAGKKQKLPR